VEAEQVQGFTGSEKYPQGQGYPQSDKFLVRSKEWKNHAESIFQGNAI
jgi:hypothetical protein